MATGGGGMAARDREEEVGDQREWCAVCLERYQRPKLLPCFHTFCQSCLQGVAGSSPSFPCPSCRTVTLLPPGGVPALRTNVYISQAMDSTPPARMCDVCSDDTKAITSCLHCQQRYCGPCRKVHDSIPLCRTHTVVPIHPGSAGTGGVQGDGAGQREQEEMCGKHKKQAIVLHCVPCRASICLQCKLTAHEGHPTEDLQDAGDKVRTRLQERLEMVNQNTSRLQGVLSVLENRKISLATLHRTTKQGVTNRAKKAHQLVTDCEEKTLSSLQTLNQDLLKPLSAIKESLQHRHSALAAQADHITRVLRENKDRDLMDLEASLKEVDYDPEQVASILKSVQSDAAPYSCENNSLAVSAEHLQEFLGLLRRKPDDKNPACASSGSMASGASVAGSQGRAQSSAVSSPVCPSVRITEVIYSQHSRSEVTVVCPTSEKRAWIKYKPSGEGEVMALFGRQGRLKNIDDDFPGDVMVTVLGDITIGFGDIKYSLSQREYTMLYSVKPSDVKTRKTKIRLDLFDSTARSCKQFLYTYGSGQCCMYHVTSMDPSQWEKTVIGTMTFLYTTLREGYFGYLTDASRCGKYFVFKSPGGAHLYLKAQSGGLMQVSTYRDPKRKVLDACFFPVGGRESLLVLVQGDYRVHIVDHTDGCRFVQYLDTGDVTLQCPRLLGSDQETVLWVACDGGCVLMMEI